MKKLIFRNIFKDISTLFIIISLALTLIVWVIQAVNYLDIVSEDGHNFAVYFKFSLLSLPKIFNKLMLFVFFISVYFTLSKYEENNEILIFWSFGITKKEFINNLVKLSFFYFLIYLVLSIFVVPKTQDMARSYIRTSNIDYFPSLIKSNHFNDTVSDLTIYVDKKNIDGSIDNLFIKQNLGGNKSKITTARKGIIKKKGNDFYVILYNGKIINIDKKNTNIILFDKSDFNLSRFKTKTTTFPKIQETSTDKLIDCVNYFQNYNVGFEEDLFRCNKESINSVAQEIYKRIILPIYIIISGFIASFLVIKSKNQNNFNKFKIFIFSLGFVFIIFSEGSSNFVSYHDLNKTFIALTPIILSLFLYLFFNFVSGRSKKL